MRAARSTMSGYGMRRPRRSMWRTVRRVVTVGREGQRTAFLRCDLSGFEDDEAL
jgi:hypothetical protein